MASATARSHPYYLSLCRASPVVLCEAPYLLSCFLPTTDLIASHHSCCTTLPITQHTNTNSAHHSICRPVQHWASTVSIVIHHCPSTTLLLIIHQTNSIGICTPCISSPTKLPLELSSPHLHKANLALPYLTLYFCNGHLRTHARAQQCLVTSSPSPKSKPCRI